MTPNHEAYTRSELEKVGEQLPIRGPFCAKCGMHIPQFDIPSKDLRRIRWMTKEQPILAIRELRELTECPEKWARIWVDHAGFPDGLLKFPVCNSSSRKGGKGYDIDQLLLESDVFRFVSNLCCSIETSRDQLNSREIDVVTASQCQTGVGSDGLEGWLSNNPHIVPIEEARDAFQAIGAVRHTNVMQQLLDVFSTCEDSDDPEEFFRVFSLQQTRERIVELGEGFAQVGAEEDIDSLIRTYVERHIADFR